MSLTWPAKDPDEVLDYQVDWTDRLDGDTIATSSFVLTTPAGLTKDSNTNTATSATIWLSGGTAGLTASILNRIVTAGGRTMDEVISLAIVDTLVVESGARLALADSYISVADADVYHARRANAAWSALSASDKEAALRKATDYIGEAYRTRWAGARMTATQALDWPRYGVTRRDGPGFSASFYPTDAVPAEVVRACAELAARAISGDLAPDLSQAIKREKVGPIEVEYQDYSTASKTYRGIDNLLAPLLAGGGSIRVLRA